MFLFLLLFLLLFSYFYLFVFLFESCNFICFIDSCGGFCCFSASFSFDSFLHFFPILLVDSCFIFFNFDSLSLNILPIMIGTLAVRSLRIKSLNPLGNVPFIDRSKIHL